MSDAQNEFFAQAVRPLFAAYSESTGARNEIVTAVSGKKIRVTAWTLNAAGGENDITWESGATALSGAFEIANNATAGASFAGGLFETTAGAALNATQSGATLVAGHITYVLV